MSHTSPPSWVSPLARAGYAGKGIVYTVIGVFSLMLACGYGGDIVGSSGALEKIGALPFGSVLLVVTGVGLLAYSAYRLLCAFVDAEREGEDKKGIAKRLGYFGSGAAYAALGIAAFTGLGGSGGGGDKKEEAAAKALTFPGANWIIGLIGLAIIAAGIFQWVKVYKGSYKTKFTLDSFAAGKRQWVERLAKLGLGARGVIFIIIGGSVLIAGIQSDAGEVMGLGEALEMILGRSYGAILLGLVAFGLICYGIYCEVLAVWGNFGKNG